MERFILVVVLCFAWTHQVFSDDHDKWNYVEGGKYGPANWTGVCQTGKKQTPIDIKSKDTYKKDLGELTLTNYNKKTNAKFTATNNGHGLTISFPGDVYNVSGADLGGVFTTVQFHLHWGSNNSIGSEHFLDGKQYAAELHFVSYNTKYENISVAVDKADGLAVLGVFIEVKGENNTNYDFLKYAKGVIYKGNETKDIEAFKFQGMLPADRSKFFRYKGSLTTPGCFESVTWTVFKDPVAISQDQMDLLRMLIDSDGQQMVNNFRPVLPLNDRKVYSSFTIPGQRTTPPPTSMGPTADHDKWNYVKDGPYGPRNWGGDCQTGKKQTPIDIKSKDSTWKKDFGELTLTNYSEMPNVNFNATNNGHSLTISFPEDVYSVSGADLGGVFTTVQFHLHWGSTNSKGSEHFLDGKQYAAELHFVSYNTKYESLSVAVDKPDGLAVLGVFIEVEGDNNTNYNFLNYGKDVIRKGQKKEGIEAFKFQGMLPSNRSNFFRYKGSLTTPGCFESVTWTVFNEPVTISQYQMDLLRMLIDSDNQPMVNNFRPVLPLNDRKVYSSFTIPGQRATPPPTSMGPTAGATAALFLLMLVAALFMH